MMVYFINPHLAGVTEANFPEDFPMLSDDSDHFIYDNGKALYYYGPHDIETIKRHIDAYLRGRK